MGYIDDKKGTKSPYKKRISPLVHPSGPEYINKALGGWGFSQLELAESAKDSTIQIVVKTASTVVDDPACFGSTLSLPVYPGSLRSVRIVREVRQLERLRRGLTC